MRNPCEQIFRLAVGMEKFVFIPDILIQEFGALPLIAPLYALAGQNGLVVVGTAVQVADLAVLEQREPVYHVAMLAAEQQETLRCVQALDTCASEHVGDLKDLFLFKVLIIGL